MSWASKRNTTREEDNAYCLMGLFDINMPMLYGEGARAFIRLQEEIIKASTDQSIFAWYWSQATPQEGLLAPSPAAFVDSGNIVPYIVLNSPWSVTNKGINIEVPLLNGVDLQSNLPMTLRARCNSDHEQDTRCIAVLNCRERFTNSFIAILLDKVEIGDVSWRIGANEKINIDAKQVWQKNKYRSIDVHKTRNLKLTRTPTYEQCFVKIEGLQGHGFNLGDIYVPRWLMDQDIKPTFKTNQAVVFQIPSYSYGDDTEPFGGLSFTSRLGYCFNLLLRITHKLEINVVTTVESESITDVVTSFYYREHARLLRRWKDNSDRILVQDPFGGTIWVVTRRQMICGRRSYAIELGHTEMEQD